MNTKMTSFSQRHPLIRGFFIITSLVYVQSIFGILKHIFFKHIQRWFLTNIIHKITYAIKQVIRLWQC